MKKPIYKSIFASRLLCLVLVALASVIARAADGDLDAAFSGDGKVKTDINNTFDAGSAMVIQPDGKIVVAGYSVFNDPAFMSIVRYNPDGSLDINFGSGGKVASDVFITQMRVDLAIQSDGKIVVVGTVPPETGFPTNFGIARFNADGTPDMSFGVGGKAIADFGGNYDEPSSLTIQADGKVVVAGVTAPDANFLLSDFAFARFDANGNLDPTFGIAGLVSLDFTNVYDRANAVTVQPDGKIVGVGITTPSGTDGDFAAVRLEANGSPDVAFGAAGKVTTDFFGDRDEAHAIVIQPVDGKMVVAGKAGLATNVADFGLVRYLADGSLDPGFGVGGMVKTDFFNLPDAAYDVALQSDGKIVASGPICPDASNIETLVDFGTARYNIDGTLDATFGTAGKVTTDFGHIDEAHAVAIQANCQIVVAGYSWPIETGNSDIALARYLSSGNGCNVEPPSGTTCPRTHGYWRTHPEDWPVDSMVLGTQTYIKPELMSLLSISSQTDASITVARQLIAAKLNIANGSDPAPIAATIANADALLATFSGKLAYKVKASSTTGQQMTAASVQLTAYNQGEMTPSCTP